MPTILVVDDEKSIRRTLREILEYEEYTVDEADETFTVALSDPTEGTLLRVRMSERAPMDDEEEQSVSDRSRAFHGRATDIDQMSDGIRAFTGLTAAVLSADYRIMLVDEPEAFLRSNVHGVYVLLDAVDVAGEARNDDPTRRLGNDAFEPEASDGFAHLDGRSRELGR